MQNLFSRWTEVSARKGLALVFMQGHRCACGLPSVVQRPRWEEASNPLLPCRSFPGPARVCVAQGLVWPVLARTAAAVTTPLGAPCPPRLVSWGWVG